MFPNNMQNMKHTKRGNSEVDVDWYGKSRYKGINFNFIYARNWIEYLYWIAVV